MAKKKLTLEIFQKIEEILCRFAHWREHVHVIFTCIIIDDLYYYFYYYYYWFTSGWAQPMLKKCSRTI